MTEHQPRRLRQAVLSTACVMWSLAIAGCNHPLAQRSAWQWDAARVFAGDTDDQSARIRPVQHEGFYTLVREWDADGRVSPSALSPGELTEAYLYPGDLLGFRKTDRGSVVAIESEREVEITLAEGVHYIWYREDNGWDSLGSNTLLILGVVGFSVLVGFLVANSDESSVSFN